MIVKILIKKFANKSFAKFNNKSILPKSNIKSNTDSNPLNKISEQLSKNKKEEEFLYNQLSALENSYHEVSNKNISGMKNEYLNSYNNIKKQISENSFNHVNLLYKKGLRVNFEEMSLNFVNENVLGYYKYDNGAWGDYFKPYTLPINDDTLAEHYHDEATHERTIQTEQKIANIVIRTFYNDDKSLDFAFYNEYSNNNLIKNVEGDSLVNKSGYFEIDTLDKVTKSNENFAINENLEDTRTNESEIGTSLTLYSYAGKYPNEDISDNSLIRDTFNKVKGI
jgi:hypothetical protein